MKGVRTPTGSSRGSEGEGQRVCTSASYPCGWLGGSEPHKCLVLGTHKECPFEKVRCDAVTKDKGEAESAKALKGVEAGFCLALFSFVGDWGQRTWKGTCKVLSTRMTCGSIGRGCQRDSECVVQRPQLAIIRTPAF